MADFPKYASVILDISLDKTLDYGIPEKFIPEAKRGKRVAVSVKGHLRKGYIYEIKTEKAYPKIQPILDILSETEVITEDLFELALWMSKYYNAALSQILRVMLPASVRKETKPKEQLFVRRAKTKEELRQLCETLRNKSAAQCAVLEAMLLANKGMLLSELLEKTGGSRSPVDSLAKKGCLCVDIVRLDRSPLVGEEYFQTKAKKLNPDQQAALEKIYSGLENARFETHLLFGITGSGKTEVYLQAIEKALQAGKGSIVLVPEISLTAQTIERFRSRFKEKIAVLHHRLSHGERFDAWSNIRNGKAKIVIGARSAIFSPVQNLGLIIVDEEHEQSYKNSEEAPCYQARDIAVMRASLTKSVVILGSATPSLESFHNAMQGKYILSKLHGRAEASQKPHVVIVDMKKEFERAKGFTNFSESLLDGIKKRHERGEQSILFLNRRGYHTTFFCDACRKPISCPHCDMALTLHLKENFLGCHLCGFSFSPPPKECPECKQSGPMKYKGVGTELLESSLKAIFPEIRTLRIDADTTRHKGSHQKLLREFGTGKADVLIGTQMIAKGLHFSEVTLVGVINCDVSLNIPDFRASETVFQLITQVAGRAGRGSEPGVVILQTCMPDNSTILHAANQDYESFYKEEIQVREYFKYPPFSHMIKIHFSGKEEKKTYKTAESLRTELLKILPNDVELNPVLPSGHAKVKDHYRFQFILRGQNIYLMNRAIKRALGSLHLPSSIKILIDVNPSSVYF